MSKFIPDLLSTINTSLENVQRYGTTGTIVDPSYFKTAMSETLLTYKDSDIASSLGDFTTFNDEVKNAPQIEIEPQITINSGTGKVDDRQYLFMINYGGLFEAVSATECVDLPYPQCGVQGSCDSLYDHKIAGESEMAEVEMKRQRFNFSECLNDLMSVTGRNIYMKVLQGQLDISVKETQSLGEAIVGQVMTAIERASYKREILEHFSDNGVVARVLEPANVTSTSVSVKMSDTSLLFTKETYVVVRPTSGNECTPICDRTIQVVGLVQNHSVFNPQMDKADLKIAYTLDTNVAMPNVALQAGDLLVAVNGKTFTYTGGVFGGNSYLQFQPEFGVNAGIITTAGEVPSCCNFNGWRSLVKLAYDVENEVQGLKYMGLDVLGGYYKNLLKPELIDDCCGLATQHSFDPFELMNVVRRVEGVIQEAQTASWGTGFGFLNNPEIMIYARQYTMENLKKNLLANYPSVNAQKTITITEAGKLILNEADMVTSIDFGTKYPVSLKQVVRGLPEGVIIIQPKNSWATFVVKGLKGTEAQYNFGNLGRLMPDVPSTLPLTQQMMDQYKNTYVYYYNNSCNPESVYIKYQAQRYFNRYNLLPGATTIVLNAKFVRPGDCPNGTCVDKCTCA